MKRRRIVDLLIGRPLASWEEQENKLSVISGVPVLGLDALSSAAYGPEAALAVLIPLGLLAPIYGAFISVGIIILLAIVYMSYRQTISAYPTGGGSYTVARQNLGERVGLLAAAALLLDYVLNVAVGISAGVAAVASAIPSLHGYMLPLCLALLVLLTIINLRGLREAGLLFSAPTYLFVLALGGVLLVGVIRAFTGNAHPINPPSTPQGVVHAAGIWMIMRAFASGCTAMTGVEAVSNGVPYFAKPAAKRAIATLTVIVAVLAFLLIGVAITSRAYGVVAMPQEQAGYRSVLSQIAEAVAGRGAFYYTTIAAILIVLTLSANTSFAGFPRVCHVVAADRYLPYAFGQRGRRLVYSLGILVLAAIAGLLLIVFRGITDRLIPLFAVGAFTAFTLSQAGMVAHWRRELSRSSSHENHTRIMLSLVANATGAVATGVTLLVIIIAKFTEGAWISVLVVGGILTLFWYVRRRYEAVSQAIDNPGELKLPSNAPPVVVIPVKDWSSPSERAIRFGLRLSPTVLAVHVSDEQQDADKLRDIWAKQVDAPLQQSGITPPRFIQLASPYRQFVEPLLHYIDELECESPDRVIAIIIPELVVRSYTDYLMHNHRAQQLKDALLARGDRRVIVINVPWYLPDEGLHEPVCKVVLDNERHTIQTPPAPPPRTSGSIVLPTSDT